MIEIWSSAKTLSESYHNALTQLWYYGKETDCADWNCKQLECSMTMIVGKPLVEPMISRCWIGGAYELQQYVMEILDGILDFKIKDDLTWDYTYHERYAWQYDWLINELKRNPSTRRAVLSIRDPKIDMEVDDPACLQHIQYFIRDDKLHCKVLMRSNDACKATFMNAFAFIMLQKKIADELGIEVGTYTHRANSFHCYEKDYKMLEDYVKRIDSASPDTYDYKEEWKELMESYIPKIKEQVEKLKM